MFHYAALNHTSKLWHFLNHLSV